jgi:IclR family transcriptional regulator, acetate operon repressor
LQQHLRVVREQGYAVDNEERYEGVRCVAAPVFGHDGLVVGSIGVSAASSQMSFEQLDEATEVVLDVARHMSTKLGHQVGT